jgi:hypothetical protein
VDERRREALQENNKRKQKEGRAGHRRETGGGEEPKVVTPLSGRIDTLRTPPTRCLAEERELGGYTFEGRSLASEHIHTHKEGCKCCQVRFSSVIKRRNKHARVLCACVLLDSNTAPLLRTMLVSFFFFFALPLIPCLSEKEDSSICLLYCRDVHELHPFHHPKRD